MGRMYRNTEESVFPRSTLRQKQHRPTYVCLSCHLVAVVAVVVADQRKLRLSCHLALCPSVRLLSHCNTLPLHIRNNASIFHAVFVNYSKPSFRTL